jgi:hypothetical protein
MPESRGRRPTKRSQIQSRTQDQSKEHWSQWRKYIVAVVVFFTGVIGLASAVVTFLPRLQIDVSQEVQSGSPFPASMTITNGLLPLDQVSIYVRICSALSSDLGGTILGRKTCRGPSGGSGGVTTPAWQNHHLMTDEKWIVPMGRNVPFASGVIAADISIAVTYWPWLVPKPWFMELRESETRLQIHTQPDGTLIWVPLPVD